MSETLLKPKPKTVAPFYTIPVDNYISRSFLEKENSRLWPTVWQVAGRVEDVPNVGDFLTYDVANETIVVVRVKDGSLRAYHNVCPHRGRKLTEGCGHASQFRCRYHGWTFDLEGRSTQVMDRDDWGGQLDDDDIALHPVKVDTWGGFVFINMDPESVPLLQFLETIPSYLDPFEIENMRYRWNVQMYLPCNWKVALEAFMEGYHVAATHPQLLAIQGDDYTQGKAQGKHAHFGYWESQIPIGVPSPRLNEAPVKDFRAGVVNFLQVMEDELAAIFTDRDLEGAKRIMSELPADVDHMTALGAAIEFGRKAAEADGAGYPAKLDFETLAKAGADWHIFPNCVTLPWFDGALWYRARPDGDNPDNCIFDIWSLKRYAPGTEPKVEPKIYKTMEGATAGRILDQDITNMGAVQQGMKSKSFKHARPNPIQEVPVTNFHRELERIVLGNAPD